MTCSRIGRRAIVVSPLIFVIVAFAMLLAIPRQALAGGGCTSGIATRGACAQAQRRSAHKRSKAKKHHAKHSASKKKAKKHVKRAAALSPAGPITQGAPVCEDGSTPIALGGGVYSCDDESEPACENGTKPTQSTSDGSLVCLAVVHQASRSGVPAHGSDAPPGSSAAVCEDGRAPVRASHGSYSCADGSEPECEDGMEPTLSASGSTLICEAAPEEEEGPSAEEEIEPEEISLAQSAA